MKGRNMDYFAALYNVARVVNASLDPSLVLQEIVRCVVESMNVKACRVTDMAAFIAGKGC